MNNFPPVSVCDGLANLSENIEPLINGEHRAFTAQELIQRDSVRLLAKKQNRPILTFSRWVRFENARVIQPIQELEFANCCLSDDFTLVLGGLA